MQGTAPHLSLGRLVANQMGGRMDIEDSGGVK